MKKTEFSGYVSLTLFVFCSGLALTGMINWLLLPRGSETHEGFLITMRHFFRDVHQWMGLFFLIAVLVHLWLHKDYIARSWSRFMEKNRMNRD